MGQIHGSGTGWENTAIVDDSGRLLVSASIIGSIVIGSVSANVDSIYVQSGANIDLGSAWTNVGSVVISGTVNTTPGSESVITAGSVEVYQNTATDLDVNIGNIGSVRVEWGVGSVQFTGSTEVFQTTAADMLVDIGNIGSVRTLGGAGSVIVSGGILGSVAITTGSINIFGDITAVNESVAALGSITTGSGTLMMGIFGVAPGSGAPIRMFGGGSYVGIAGSVSLFGVGSFTAGSVGVIGSLEVYQTAAADMLVDIGQIGSVAITGDVVVHAGSVQLYDSSTGSVHNIGSIEVHGQNTLGSVHTIGSREIYGNLTATNDSVAALGSITTGSGTLMMGIFGVAPGSGAPIRMFGGGSYVGIAGSVQLYDSLGSIEIWQTTAGDLTVDIGQIGSVAITGDVIVHAGSVQLYDSSTGSVHNIGSIEVFQQTAASLDVTSIQGTDPWIVLGSVRLTGASTGSVHNIGSIEIYGDITASNPSVGAVGSITLGSATLMAGIFGVAPGSYVPLRMFGGSYVGIAGSVQTYSPLGVGSIIASGITAITGSVTIIDSRTGSVGVVGSIEVYQQSATNLEVNATQVTSPWTVDGTVNLGTAWTGVGSIIASGITEIRGVTGSVHNIGSIEVYGPIGSLHTIGSTQVYGPTGSIHNIGSIEIFQTTAADLTVAFDNSGYAFSGATFTAAGSSTIFTPATGSKTQLKSFTISASTAQEVALFFSGTTRIPIVGFRVPNSGTVIMNLLGAEPSGAADGELQVSRSDGGNTDVSVFVRSVA